MQLEQQVCFLGLAKKLKELGVEQESLWFWVKSIVYGWMVASKSNVFGLESYPAFTVSELGVLLPEIVVDEEDGSEFSVIHFENMGSFYTAYNYNNTNENVFVEGAYSEADARAKMLIYLIENELWQTESRSKL